MSRQRAQFPLAFGMALLALLLPAAASAHEQVESGDYVFEIGWLQEPVIVGESNGLDLFVAPKSDPEAGIADLTTLQFTVEFGSASQVYDLTPDEERPGFYSAAFVPTRVGQYTFHLTGTIEDQAIDVSVEPEEVVEAGTLAFPEMAASAVSTQTLAVAGLLFGLCGTALGAVALLKKK
jgi:hypothetical protein